MEPAEAILALVREAVPTLEVFDGKPPPVAERPQRFVVVYLAPGVLEAGNVADRADRVRISWQVTVIATADDPRQLKDVAWQARWGAGRIRDHFVTSRLHPAGSKIRHTLSSRRGDDDQLVTTQAAAVVDQYEALA